MNTIIVDLAIPFINIIILYISVYTTFSNTYGKNASKVIINQNTCDK